MGVGNKHHHQLSDTTVADWGAGTDRCTCAAQLHYGKRKQVRKRRGKCEATAPTKEDSSLAGIMDKPFELRLKGGDR